MAPRSNDARRTPAPRGGDGTAAEAASGAVRRAPYSDNPAVGTRGLRTQQRILDAALQVFGEHGYERSTIDKIGQLAGCSRVSIYQYFSGKEDVFRHLAGQVARQLRASAEALEPLTPDAAGWSALRAWVARYAEVYARYEPVFRAFGAAAESDAALAGGSGRVGGRNLALFQSKLAGPALPPRQLDPVVALLHAGVTTTFDISSILGEALPRAYTRQRVEVALADVLHRSLFGLLPDVNTHPPGERPPTLPISRALLEVFEQATAFEAEAARPARRALAALLAVGQDVIVRRGYQGTRVDDLVEAAGVSHGAFYRYFDNKDEFVRVVAVGALGAVSAALGEVPADADRATLRRWLRRYNAVHAENGATIRVWTEASANPLSGDRAAVFDWGRRRLLRLLRDRGFGDVDAEAVVLLAVVEVFGSVPRPPAEVDAALHIIEQGFLGIPSTG
jgi:AcrR family transcriptional regulator